MRYSLIAGLGIMFALQTTAASAAEEELNLYTTREPKLVEPLLDAFQQETGIKVNTIFMKDGMVERLEQEGEASPADILMTVDIGNLVDFVDRGLTQPIESEVLNAAIPENLRDKDGNWFTLSLRARALYAAKDLDLTSFHYEDLDNPEWKGKVCIRSGQHPYNIALTAAYITHHGVDETKTWLEGV
ncbi:MAG: extracellular solute-binding protein [Paracoccus sp. (in: a-proteobacteria)]